MANLVSMRICSGLRQHGMVRLFEQAHDRVAIFWHPLWYARKQEEIMTPAFAKSDRIGQVERILFDSGMALSQAEIARRCEVHRSTIGRLIQGMVDYGIPVRYDEQGRIYIERTAYISRVYLKLHEALAVFLACRLLARYSDKPNANTITALEKLGTSLHGVMPPLGEHITRTSAELKTHLPKSTSQYQQILEELTKAWADSKKVRVWYRPLNS